jgi:uncharacterized protein
MALKMHYLDINRYIDECMQQNLSPQELIRIIVSAFVEHPDEITIHAIEADQLTVFELRANSSDTGRIIGKNGRTVRALREILLTMQGTSKRRFELEIANNARETSLARPAQEEAAS